MQPDQRLRSSYSAGESWCTNTTSGTCVNWRVHAQSRPRIVLTAACVAGELAIPSDRDRPAAAEHQPAGTTRLAFRRGASATSWRRATSFSNPATFAQRLLAAVATSYSPESRRYKSLEAHGQLARCLHCARASGPFSASRGERDGVGRLDCSRKTPESVWDGRRGAGYRTRHRGSTDPLLPATALRCRPRQLATPSNAPPDRQARELRTGARTIVSSAGHARRVAEETALMIELQSRSSELTIP
jgi:hypothetical protein